jgi:hypothetical protein
MKAQFSLPPKTTHEQVVDALKGSPFDKWVLNYTFWKGLDHSRVRCAVLVVDLPDASQVELSVLLIPLLDNLICAYFHKVFSHMEVY